jgi:hypothetical protein
LQKHCCPATPQEIESHLRKICDEKYIGKKVRCLVSGEYTVDRFWEYDDIKDRICYHTDVEGEGAWLYGNGKFAEIIPDKKKLPKTKKEFSKCFKDWLVYSGSTDDFLNQYED